MVGAASRRGALAGHEETFAVTALAKSNRATPKAHLPGNHTHGRTAGYSSAAADPRERPRCRWAVVPAPDNGNDLTDNAQRRLVKKWFVEGRRDYAAR